MGWGHNMTTKTISVNAQKFYLLRTHMHAKLPLTLLCSHTNCILFLQRSPIWACALTKVRITQKVYSQNFIRAEIFTTHFKFLFYIWVFVLAETCSKFDPINRRHFLLMIHFLSLTWVSDIKIEPKEFCASDIKLESMKLSLVLYLSD